MTIAASPPVIGRSARVLLVLAVFIGALLTGSSPVLAGPQPMGVWPLAPAPPVVRGFDPPESPWGAGHRGVDLLGRPGQAVRSALPGRVSWSGVLAGRGVVVVDHGATRTTYEPLAARLRAGTVVAAGARIGRLAPLGSHCLPRTCLHWGWIEGETYLDPLRLVGTAGPVRLLPLSQEGPAGPLDAGGSSWTRPARSQTPMPYAAWRPVAVALRTPLAQALGWACW